jgi:ZIP family zinc transporter/zinc and cadmium transporter
MAVEFNVLFYSSIAGLSTILGIILVILKEKLVIKYSHYVNSFAAGLILGVAFFHLFPESLEISDNALLFILIGFLVFYLLENVMVLHSGSEIHFKEKKGSRHTKGQVMFSGLFFHSFVDGIIIGIGFETDFKLGLLTSLGVIAHELPEGVTTFALLINSMERKTALKLSIVVGLATPLGASISLTFINSLSEAMVGLMLGIAGGSFLYIAASDLIPETHEEKGFENSGFLLIGVICLYLLSKTIGG